MTPRLLASALALLALQACSKAPRPVGAASADEGPPSALPAPAATSRAVSASPTPSTCNRKAEPCAAGNLRRIAEGAWSTTEIGAFVARSRLGAVAVLAEGQRVALERECRPPGEYFQAQGEDPNASFFATEFMLLAPEWLNDQPGCATATHLVAAFAIGDARAEPRSPSERGPLPEYATGDPFEALLVPLPCSQSSAATRPRGCVGRGLTRIERQRRAGELLASAGELPGSVASLLEAYALAPEDGAALERLVEIGPGRRERPGLDVHLFSQARALLDGSRARSSWPRFGLGLDRAEHAPTAAAPPFLTCFPGIFAPAPGRGTSCWDSRDPRLGDR